MTVATDAATHSRVQRRAGAEWKAAAAASSATLLTWALAILFFFPVFWMVLTGFKTEGDAATIPPSLSFSPTLEQYREIGSRGIWPYLSNTLTAVTLSTAIVLVLALPAAYALSLNPIKRWRDGLFFFLSTRFLPVAGVIASIFILAKDLQLLNTTMVLVVLYAAMNLPVAIWMIRSFMLEIPVEVLEAARIDGAGLVNSIRFIMMPLLAPGIAATALICVIFAWNEFFLAAILTSSDSSGTLPVFMTGFITSQGQYWAQLSAAATVCSIPVVIIGWAAQKQLVRGLSLGAVK